MSMTSHTIPQSKPDADVSGLPPRVAVKNDAAETPFADVLADHRSAVRSASASAIDTSHGHSKKPDESDDSLEIEEDAIPNLAALTVEIADEAAAQLSRSRALLADRSESTPALSDERLRSDSEQSTSPDRSAVRGAPYNPNAMPDALTSPGLTGDTRVALRGGTSLTTPSTDSPSTTKRSVRANSPSVSEAAHALPADGQEPVAGAAVKKIIGHDATLAGPLGPPSHSSNAGVAAPSMATALNNDTRLPPTAAPTSPITAAPAFDAAIRPTSIVAAQVAVPVGHDRWGQVLGEQVIHLAHKASVGIHVAELRLDPPDLGPLRIQIHVGDGFAHASFVSAHAAVRHALELAMPQLQHALSQSGISLGETDVHDREPQSFAENRQRGDFSEDAGSGGDSPETAAGRSSGVPAVHVRALEGLVDTFV
jgi:flagellar hook-length control protein FliK